MTIFNARDYAQTIYDLSLRRDLIRLGGEISAKAAAMSIESEPKDQIEDRCRLAPQELEKSVDRLHGGGEPKTRSRTFR